MRAAEDESLWRDRAQLADAALTELDHNEDLRTTTRGIVTTGEASRRPCSANASVSILRSPPRRAPEQSARCAADNN